MQQQFSVQERERERSHFSRWNGLFKSSFQDTNLSLSQQSARGARGIPGLETWVSCLVLCDGASLGLFLILSFFICKMEEQLYQPVRVGGRIV